MLQSHNTSSLFLRLFPLKNFLSLSIEHNRPNLENYCCQGHQFSHFSFPDPLNLTYLKLFKQTFEQKTWGTYLQSIIKFCP